MSRARPIIGHLYPALAIALWIATTPAPARGTTPAQLCTGGLTTTTCTVSGTVSVDVGGLVAPLTLDLGARDLVVAGSARIVMRNDSPPGSGTYRSLHLQARSVLVQPGAIVNGNGSTAIFGFQATDGGITIQSAGAQVAKIDVSGGGGAIRLIASGTIDVTGSLLAKDAAVADSAGGEIDVCAGSWNPGQFPSCSAFTGAVLLHNDLDVAALGEGSTGGDVEIAGTQASVADIDVSATGLDSSGGGILLRTADGTLTTGALRAGTVGSQSFAGTIEIATTSGSATLGALDASGRGVDAGGGQITLAIGGSLHVTGPISATGQGDGDAGSAELVAGSGILLDGSVDVSGAASASAGELLIDSTAGDVIARGALQASGGAGDGDGGDIDVRAHDGSIQIQAGATSRGGTGVEYGYLTCGGSGGIRLYAAHDLGVAGTLDAAPGTGCSPNRLCPNPVDDTCTTDFFAVSLSAVDGDVTLQPGVKILGRGSDLGESASVFVKGGRNVTLGEIDVGGESSAGNVLAEAGATLTALTVIDAAATNPDGYAGNVTLRACDIQVQASLPSQLRVDTRGKATGSAQGVTRLEAGGRITASGTFRAAAKNLVRYRGLAPVLTNAVFSPTADVSQDPAIPACGEIAPCGDGVLTGGEVCDDGNTASCDGCASDCSRAEGVCGDGVRECAEQCDDGNLDDGDGCDANCELIAGRFLMPGAPRDTAGCLAEWSLGTTSGVTDPRSGFPTRLQTCMDGDPACDADATDDGRCTFDTQICLRASDPRLPGCTPDPLRWVRLGAPYPLSSTNPTNIANGNALLQALSALGVSVYAGTTLVSSGAADTQTNHCTASVPLLVPLGSSSTVKKDFVLLAEDMSGLRMTSNSLTLECVANPAVCGNGVLEQFEGCDDGNTNSCDGCSADCRVQSCGDGVVQCSEQCDEGPRNGQPGSGCTATCGEPPATLRIPGGGGRRLDCGFEWALAMSPSSVAMDRKGIAKNRQTCVDNDPQCDFNPLVGSCRLHAWACLGGADSRLGCSATAITGLTVTKPASTALDAELAARRGIENAVAALGSPMGPGEICTSRIDFDVPAVTKPMQLGTRASLEGAGKDTDTLRLWCAPQH